VASLHCSCAKALAMNTKQFSRSLRILRQPAVAVVCVAILLLVSPHYPNRFMVSIGFTIDALSCGCLLMYATEQTDSVVGKILNHPVAKHFGIISYSLYLWEQMFTGPNTRFAPWNLLAVIACAEVSYWCIERPSFSIRDRLFPPVAVARHPDRTLAGVPQ
jgi:peptidoglycan/LPS O-acetylase OafA/YrhL